ncbi:MAG: hypothetical protein GX032_00830, partial [Tenericutes bacterium]|nr:hypothetical protein [Mycoplasmatota bacterium]
MKKLFKKSSLFFTLLLATVFLTTNVYAWYTPNKTSFALGGVYDDGLDTTADANNAHSAYSTMGLSYTKKLNNTNKTAVMGSHGNGTSYLNSGIVFMSGHGNSSLMSFMNNGTNKFYIQGNTNTTGSYIGIGNYINSSNALVVLGGCKTAEGNSNISKYVVDQGAKSSIGWTTTINNAGSHTNWLKRFNNKIKDKSTTVSAAKSSADGHIYLDNTVKNGKIYGFGNYNPWYFMNGGSYSKSSSDENYYNSIFNLNENEYLVTTKIDSKNIEKIIVDFITKELDKDFNIQDYKLEINGNDTIYYDYVLYINDVRTSFGYTVALIDNSIVKLYDNMDSKSAAEIKRAVKEIYPESKKIESISLKIDEKINSKYKNEKISKYMITPYYDVETNKIFVVGMYSVEFSDGTFGSASYSEEV